MQTSWQKKMEVPDKTQTIIWKSETLVICLTLQQNNLADYEETETKFNAFFKLQNKSNETVSNKTDNSCTFTFNHNLTTAARV